jgi:hypothetical protein
MTLCLHSLFHLTTRSQHSNSQGHQAFPLVIKLKDNFTSSCDDTYCSFSPMIPICLDHTFTQYQDLLLHTTVIDCFHATPSNSNHLVITMGRHNFYDEFPNVYSFTDKDLGLSMDEPNFDQYDFNYNLKDLQEPPKMDNDVISNMQLPTLQKWSYYLRDAPVQCDEEMTATYSNLIAYATNLEAELNCTICNIQLWGEIDASHWYLMSPTT